jgi:hypothetical protein
MPKMVKRITSITTERRAPPSTPELHKNFMNFRFNHESQRNVRPANLAGHGEWTTPNASGRADTRGVGTALETGRIEAPRNDPGATKV